MCGDISGGDNSERRLSCILFSYGLAWNGSVLNAKYTYELKFPLLHRRVNNDDT